jgi:hypothetical protein
VSSVLEKMPEAVPESLPEAVLESAVGMAATSSPGVTPW